MGKADLKRCHRFYGLIEQIRQNVTSELRSVCWHEGNVKWRQNVSSEKFIIIGRILESITGSLRTDIDVGITNKKGAVYLCC